MPRTGWLVSGVAQAESVADHTTATALLALTLGSWINEAPAEHGLAEPVDLGKLAHIALVHDLAESAVTDLPHGAVALLGKANKDRAEEQCLRSLWAGMPRPADWLALWQEYSSGSSPEARLTRDADKLEMVHQALAYESAGHRDLDEFWEGHRWHYAISGEIFATMVALRPGGGSSDGH